MKRFCCFAVLMLLSSSAHAGNSLSFVLGGHRIRIETSRHCNPASCVSISIPGVRQTRRARDRDRDNDIGAAPAASAPAKPLAPAPPPASDSLPPTAAPILKPSIEPVVSAPLPVTVGLAAATTQEAAAPSSGAQPSRIESITAAIAPPIEAPTVAAQPAPDLSPQISRTSHEADGAAPETPLGDWQTEGNKGSVRIEPCGPALCGHVLDASSNGNGEAMLINMKPKAAALWSGNIYSRGSGNTYYGTIEMKGPNSLRVEACALGRFFCSGNLWSRIDANPEADYLPAGIAAAAVVTPPYDAGLSPR
jgi:hypothetical protein